MDAIEKYFKGHQFLFHTMGATIALAVTLTAYAYTNFSTKAEASEITTSLEKRLDRIENKLDHLVDHFIKHKREE